MYNLYDFPMLVIDEQLKQVVSVKFSALCIAINPCLEELFLRNFHKIPVKLHIMLSYTFKLSHISCSA